MNCKLLPQVGVWCFYWFSNIFYVYLLTHGIVPAQKLWSNVTASSSPVVFFLPFWVGNFTFLCPQESKNNTFLEFLDFSNCQWFWGVCLISQFVPIPLVLTEAKRLQQAEADTRHVLKRTRSSLSDAETKYSQATGIVVHQLLIPNIILLTRRRRRNGEFGKLNDSCPLSSLLRLTSETLNNTN